MSKHLYYDVRGAQCSACATLIKPFPFEEGEQHQAMGQHLCPKDRAVVELSKCQSALEEVLREYGVSLEANWDGPSPGCVWLELTHTETGVERRVGGELA